MSSYINDNLEWLQRAQKIAHMGIWDQDPVKDFLWWSDETYRIFGLEPQSERMDFEKFLQFVRPEDSNMIKEKTALSLKSDEHPYIVDYQIILPDKKVKYLHEEALIERDPIGKPKRIIGIVRDVTTERVSEEKLKASLKEKEKILQDLEKEITERRQAEKKIKTLLQEKELLLKEVHHRIRNNMSTIKGLLSLHSGTLNNPEAKMALKEAENRVESMLVLYDKLFLSTDFQNVSAKQYFETLIGEIIKNFPNKDTVSVTYDIEDIMLGAKPIFDLGIIINELITNTMKHAFVGKDSGKIHALLSVAHGHAIFMIQDDGIEIPESVSFENPAAGFGIKLVSMLVQQLDGSIQIERNSGTKFTIKFNIA